LRFFSTLPYSTTTAKEHTLLNQVIAEEEKTHRDMPEKCITLALHKKEREEKEYV
jgi:hypothetical protein